MRADIEKQLIYRHSSIFSEYTRDFYSEGNSNKRLFSAGIFDVGEGWQPIIHSVIFAFEEINAELIKANETCKISIDSFQKHREELLVNLSHEPELDIASIKKALLVIKTASFACKYICEDCGYHHMQQNIKHGTKCNICKYRSEKQ